MYKIDQTSSMLRFYVLSYRSCMSLRNATLATLEFLSLRTFHNVMAIEISR